MIEEQALPWYGRNCTAAERQIELLLFDTLSMLLFKLQPPKRKAVDGNEQCTC